MENLQQATEKICDLKGSVLALETFVAALIDTLPPDARASLRANLQQQADIARNVLLHSVVSEHTLAAYERDIQRASTILG